MGENSKIEWTDHTFNSWIGCTKVSAGCANCYAERFGKRIGVEWGPGGARRRTSPAYWRQPLRWNAQGARDGERRRVFCASLADWLDVDVPTQWRVDLLNLILATPYLDWLLLSKRIGSWSARLHEAMSGSRLAAGWLNSNQVPHNVWLGTSVEDQATADERIPHLLAAPAAVRFVSCEPLLGPVDLRDLRCAAEDKAVLGDDATYSALDGLASGRATGGCSIQLPDRLDWVIVGGESGPGARPMHPAWARSLRDQCQAAGVAFLFKQWGEWQNGSAPGVHDEIVLTDGNHGDTAEALGYTSANAYEWGALRPTVMARVGKRAAGRLLDGREWNEFPESK